MENKQLLTVCLLTYNHKPYIAEAIEGVLMQKSNFKWDFIILDDCSTDGTREILLAYKEKYPELIKLNLNKKNLGAYQSWVNLLSLPTTKYFAYFEGDDYWTDSNKLQKQVDFLEANPSYSFCGHHVKSYNQETGETLNYGCFEKNPITISDAVTGPPIHTCSYVAKTGMGFPSDIKNLPAGDDAIICHWASKGLGYSIPEYMGVYRLSNSGTWSAFDQNEKNFRSLLIHLWVFRRYKPIYTKQSMQIAKEFIVILTEAPSNLKRLNLKDFSILTQILIASLLIFCSRKIYFYFKKQYIIISRLLK